MIFVFVLISSVGVQHCNAFIPTLGLEGPQWGPIEIIFLSVRLSAVTSASLFGNQSARPIIARSACGHSIDGNHVFSVTSESG